MSVKLSPEQKYQNYVNSHPNCKKMTFDKVCSLMVKENVLTPQEVKQLKQSSLFGFGFSAQASSDDTSGLFGFSRQIPQTNYVERKRNYSIIFKDIIVFSDNNEIDLNQFSLSELIKKYPKSKYNFIQKGNNITIVDKTTNKRVFSATDNNGIKYVKYFDSKGVKTEYEINTKSSKPHVASVVTRQADNSYKKNYYNSSGKISQSKIFKNGKILKTTAYKNGQVQRVQEGDKVSNLCAKNWHDFLTNGRIYNWSVGEDKIKKQLENLTAELNKYPDKKQFLDDYEKQFGKSFIQDLHDSSAIDDDTFYKLVDEIKKQCEDPEQRNIMNAQVLVADIYGVGNGRNLKDFLLSTVKSGNINDILIEYQKLVKDKRDVLGSKLGEVAKFLGLDKLVLDNLTPEESLIVAIAGETQYSEDDRKSMIVHIVTNLFVTYKTLENQVISSEILDSKIFKELDSYLIYTKDIKQDIRSHTTDAKKLLVDYYRITKRGDDTGLAYLKTSNSGLDLDYNTNVKQNREGDCWLLAGLISIKNKLGGAQFLKSLVEVKANGNIVVNLKGIGEKIEITKEELADRRYLVSNLNYRIFEIAIDKFHKEKAYDSDYGIFASSINGGRCDEIYNLLLGQGSMLNIQDIKDLKVFNDATKYYSLGTVRANSNAENYGLAERHAYAIKGADDKYVYIINPWNSSKTIKLTHAEFRELAPCIYVS